MAINEKTYKRLIKFRDDRDWSQFHTGENIAKSLMIEAGELLEVFQYSDKETSVEKVKEELADVLMYSMLLADRYHLDLDEIINKKMDSNEKKYPADKVRGSSKKYNKYKNK